MVYFSLNIWVSFLFVLGLLIEQHGFPYLRTMVSLLIIFFLTGFSISTVIFPKHNELSKIERVVLSFGLSIVALPFFIYLTDKFNILPINEKSIILQSFLLIWLPVVINLIRFRKNIVITPLKLKTIKKYIATNKLFVWILLLYFLVLFVPTLLYKYIPSADPYVFLIGTERIIQMGDYSLASIFSNIYNYRTFFTNLTAAIALLGNVDPYYIFKYLLVLLPAIIVVPFYYLAKRISNNKNVIFVTTVSALAVPTFIIDSWIVRPQTILFLMPIILLLYGLSLEKKSLKLLVTTILISILLVKYHEVSLIFLIIGLILVLFLLKENIKKNKLGAFYLSILIIMAIYPYIREFGYFDVIVDAFVNLKKNLIFRLWFLSGYKNVDGAYISMDAVGAIKYYLVGIGPFFIALTVLGFLSIKKTSIVIIKPVLIPYFISALVFFTIAEVFPRLGLGFLPERALPFLMLSIIPFTPNILFIITKKWRGLNKNNFFLFTITVGLAISFIITYNIVSTHQGWSSTKEVEAALWIKSNLPEKSIIVTQPANYPMVAYYAESYQAIAPKFLFDPNISSVEKYNLTKEVAKTAYPQGLLEFIKNNLTDKIKKCLQTKLLTAENNDNSYLTRNCDESSLSDNLKKIKKVEGLNLKIPENTYILYSHDKFIYRYAISKEWQESNFYEGDLSGFDDTTYFQKIYDNGPVKIWKVLN